MKISLSRKFGWTQVHGGAIVKVLMPHAVSGNGLSRQSNRFVGDVVCEEGDLAVELFNTKTNALLGYTYLSGPAIQRNLYPCFNHGCGCGNLEINSTWLEPVTGRLVSIPVPDGSADPDTLMKALIGTLMDAKYGDDDLYAFELVTDTDEDAQNAARMLSHVWGYTNDEKTPRSHLLGLVRGKGNSVALHFQPPHHVSNWAATQFQISLTLSALGHTIKKPRSRFGKRRKKKKR